ncbi:hypothetical protein COLO4_04977 [Corchorus olitorius]|uniref:Uncharacterized protein n=1 Tax=Corchorus olitorius TaxID=93759 RepID=A0A1R3KSE0_9ROSI|nr:hypothetical protein COLO4_04977 [Corchorus olitorius]
MAIVGAIVAEALGLLLAANFGSGKLGFCRTFPFFFIGNIMGFLFTAARTHCHVSSCGSGVNCLEFSALPLMVNSFYCCLPSKLILTLCYCEFFFIAIALLAHYYCCVTPMAKQAGSPQVDSLYDAWIEVSDCMLDFDKDRALEDTTSAQGSYHLVNEYIAGACDENWFLVIEETYRARLGRGDMTPATIQPVFSVGKKFNDAKTTKLFDWLQHYGKPNNNMSILHRHCYSALLPVGQSWRLYPWRLSPCLPLD